MEAAKLESSGLRVLMFPWLAHGHVLPFVELAKGLASKEFHIYLCSTAINLESMKKSVMNYHGSIELVELHLPSSPELPPHYHTTKSIPTHLIPALIKAFQMSAPAFSDIIANLKPDLLIYDGFQPWAAEAAASQGIPAVLFATSGSTSLAFFHHYHTHKDLHSFPFQAIRLKEHEEKRINSQGVDGDFASGIFKLSREIVLMKTYRGFERKYMDYLSTLCGRRLVPTGPLIAHGDGQNDSEMMKWLSERAEGSTLYISFGSENYLSKDQMRELAKGLEMSSSDVNFIWVARSHVPEGFEERMRERGVVLRGWAPQAAILAHESVGGFMTHCGWSSISESVYCGVPLLALPFKADQPVNARLVVEAGFGVEVARDGDGGFHGDAVAKAIKEVFVEGRQRLRRKVEDLREKMKEEEQGAMDQVVDELSSLCLKSPTS